MKVFGFTPKEPLAFHDIDMSALLSESRKKVLLDAIRTNAVAKNLTLKHSTCRELEVSSIPFVYCSGKPLEEEIPWLKEFYQKDVISTVRSALQRDIEPIEGMAQAITAHVLGHGMRFECHVDSYPTTANLYLQCPPTGGELAVAPAADTRGYEEIVSKATLLTPKPMELSIVHLNKNVHTVCYCWDNIHEKVPLQTLPDLTSEEFWKSARISVNFNFRDPVKKLEMPSEEDVLSTFSHVNK